MSESRQMQAAPGSAANVDVEELRAQVREKYREVAVHPDAQFHFHTGRGLAERLGYPEALLADLPDSAVESFAGVANPFSLRDLQVGERVVDAGSGGGFDSLVAAHWVGETGAVVGVDMTPEMLEKADAERQPVGCRSAVVSGRFAGIAAGGHRVGRCGDQQRGVQSLR